MKMPNLILVLLPTAFPFAAPRPTSNQHLEPNSSICSSMSRLRLYINDLNTYPTQSDLYMAEAQALSVDEGLKCPTKNGILDNGESASDACKENQEIKDALGELNYSSSEDKRVRLKGLNAACVELDEMIGCPTG